MPFIERQTFRQPWLWAVLLVVLLGTTGLMAYGMVQQLVFHRPFGSNPASDTEMAWSGGAVIVLNALVLWLMYRMELEVRVDVDALHVRFFPFIRRRFPYADIRSATARVYSPLGEYGGWGIRFGRAGKAYNVSGNEGVQLELASGERLLLGSQDANALESAIQSHLPLRSGPGR
jgi:hypothetical protein